MSKFNFLYEDPTLALEVMVLHHTEFMIQIQNFKQIV